MSDKPSKNNPALRSAILAKRSSPQFAHEVTHYLQQIAAAGPAPQHAYLKYYQNIARAFMVDVISRNGHGASRGLLCDVEMGLGKTLLAVSVVLDLAAKYRVVLLMSKSLHKNMREQIHKAVALRAATDPEFALAKLAAPKLDRWIDEHFLFLSAGAGNVIKKLDESIGAAANSVADAVISFEQRLLIVDEAHNFFRSVTNGSPIAVKLYESIMAAKDVKLLFLTGTPIASDPYELAICFNMLAGPIGGKTPLFPESYEEFCDLFVAGEAIANRAFFQNRILGLTSHVAAARLHRGATQMLPGMPETLPLRLEWVQMTLRQWGRYNLAREAERQEAGGGTKSTARIAKPKSAAGSTYRTRSRQLSNWVAPEGYGPKQISTIPPADMASPKFEKIASILDQSVGLAVVFSAWTHDGGLEPLARWLTSLGWAAAAPTDLEAAPQPHAVRPTAGPQAPAAGREARPGTPGPPAGPESAPPRAKRYALITGEQTPEQREVILRRCRAPANLWGEQIGLILLSSGGAEGLNIFYVQQLIVLEPPWKRSKLAQIISRGVRVDSHQLLPPPFRRVQPYLLLATAPAEELAGAKPDSIPTTDIELYAESGRKQVLIDSFLDAVRETSIECQVTPDASAPSWPCYRCAPDSRPLFTADIRRDLAETNPCRRAEREKVTARPVPDRPDLAWTEDPSSPWGVAVFSFDPRAAVWRRLRESDAVFVAAAKIVAPGAAAAEEKEAA